MNSANHGALVQSLQNSLNNSVWDGAVPPRYRNTVMGNAGGMSSFGNGKPPVAKPPTNSVKPPPPSQWTFQPSPLDQAPPPPSVPQQPQVGAGQSPWTMNPPVYPWMMNPAGGGGVWGQMPPQIMQYIQQMQQQPQTGGPGPTYNPQQSYGWGQY